LRGIFHCFSGTLEQAQQMIELGFYLGIGGVVTFKNGGLAPILKEIGIEKLVLETDTPYLAPVPFRGKRNEPSYLSYVISQLAIIFEISNLDVESITTSSATKLFDLSK
jgi:TatD DNase family protein